MLGCKYAVPIVNHKTGERKTVLVELNEFERLDVFHNLGDDGPLANRYAMEHANKKAPAGFVSLCDGIERMVLH